jgi:predicted NUDIX family NTP pyrophosphohydrolase
MPKQSAGILLYRKIANRLQVFLVHPGGPYFKNKDEGAWSIPKGEFTDAENPLIAAKREFFEETGQVIDGSFVPLQPVKLKSGKIIYTWAIAGDIDPEIITSNLFEIEWPPKSGKTAAFPEVDRAAWFDIDAAKIKINAAQAGLIEELERIM